MRIQGGPVLEAEDQHAAGGAAVAVQERPAVLQAVLLVGDILQMRQAQLLPAPAAVGPVEADDEAVHGDAPVHGWPVGSEGLRCGKGWCSRSGIWGWPVL